MIKIPNEIEGTEKRLQFTIVLGLFFPVLLEALFSLNGSNPKDISETVLKTGLVIFILILNYLLFEWRKKYLAELEVVVLNWTYLVTIACYASVILFFGFVANGNIQTINWSVRIFYPSVLFGAMYLPSVGICVMVWNLVRNSFKD